MLTGTNPLLLLALVLVAGVFAGHIASRAGLPSITGQILAGVLLGPSVFGVFELDAPHRLEPVTHFALGLVAVTVGSHIHLPRLRSAGRRLAYLLFLEATLTPFLVFAAVAITPGSTVTMAILLAAAAISTAPATIVALVRETRAKGVFTKTLVAAVALNNIACICIFEVARTAARATLDPEAAPWSIPLFLEPLAQMAASAALGFAVGVGLILATRRVYRSDRLATASMLAILLTSGLADWLDVSPLLSSLFLGIALSNLTPDRDEIGHRVFQDFESAILAVFFTLAGLELDFRYAAVAGGLAAAVVGTRTLGKVASAYVSMRLAGGTTRMRTYLGIALVPQAGVAVGLMILVKEDPSLASVSDLFLAVGLTSVTINEVVGPVLTRLAIRRSGEAGKDRARLLDFLHEENIVTGFDAPTKEEAIERLVALLIQSRGLQADRARLLASVLERERAESTCVGGGLAIPHGELPEGAGIAGVMALSAEGLAYDTPDGVPVHCIVLLATPPDQRDRHLEVLASLAGVVGSDPAVRHELYSSKTAAHALEVLHAEESERFNPFLEAS